MRLVRYGEMGQEKPGLIDAGGQIRDLSSHIPDLAGDALSDESMEKLRQLNPVKLPLVGMMDSVRLGACVAGVGKVVGVAINYRLHGVETGLGQPTEPALFLKATSAICGPNDNLELPPGAVKTDWEVELGVVIGKKAKNITAATAMQHVAGYCVVNDVSERAFQLERGGQQHTKGKSADTFCPLGPWLLTRDKVIDAQKLSLRAIVNGQTMQDGTTADMLFNVPRLVSYISEFMTLLPGDVISTGTPDGVGRGRKPPVYLHTGDTVELSIDSLGSQKHLVV